MDYSLEEAAKENAILVGRIAFFSSQKRFGFIQAKEGDRFITADGRGRDVFLSMTTLENSGINHPPAAGDEISFRVELDKEVPEGRTPAAAIAVIEVSMPRSSDSRPARDDPGPVENPTFAFTGGKGSFQASDIYSPGLRPEEIIQRTFRFVGNELRNDVAKIIKEKYGDTWYEKVVELRENRHRPFGKVKPDFNKWDTQAILTTILSAHDSKGKGFIFAGLLKGIRGIPYVQQLNDFRNDSAHEKNPTEKDALFAVEAAARLLEIAGKAKASAILYSVKQELEDAVNERDHKRRNLSWVQVAGGVVLVAAIAGSVNWLMSTSSPPPILPPSEEIGSSLFGERSNQKVPFVIPPDVHADGTHNSIVIDLATQWDKFD